MKSIVFIETNKSGSSREAIKAAKALGFNTHLLTKNEEFHSQKHDFPDIDEIHLVNVSNESEVDQVVKQITKHYFVAFVISLVDSYVYLSAKLSNKYCQTQLSHDAIKVMEDKLLTRTCLQNKSYSPWFIIFHKQDSIEQLLNKIEKRYPLIVKLPKSCGSKDVFLIHSEKELTEQLHRLQKVNDNDIILIEEFLQGPQVIVETIVHKGEVRVVAIVEQDILIGERFIVTGYSISPTPYEEQLNTITTAIMNDLKFTQGHCHLELRLVNDEWKLIEINPRIAGTVMNDLIYEAYGFNYVEQIIKMTLGYEPFLYRIWEECAFAKFITVSSIGKLIKVTGRNKALKVPGVTKVFIKPKKGKVLRPPLSMGHRYGYVLAKAGTKQEAVGIAEKAASLIQFHLLSKE
ncbi:ATP-grasp domain-containing protein [Bacillus solimangrovi]|uniref:ATP-grasp domain-containing protein n=1 Tax=Bacillus solimangrovi TaxID=1305675 RepID=A0A1E5LFE3_9BACI|nr:ATP-grasp domain-containing protein [Bacillus solimangrovi]OEH92776.1 hypothetical protein BFG57_01915 [Bacillus solimangrovi]